MAPVLRDMDSKSFGLHLILKLGKLLMKHFRKRTSQVMSNPKEMLQKICILSS